MMYNLRGEDVSGGAAESACVLDTVNRPVPTSAMQRQGEDCAMPESIFQNDRLFKTLLDNLSEGVYFTDLHRRIQYWNKGAERLTGFQSEEVIGKCCADNILMHTDCDGRPMCKSSDCPLAGTIRDLVNRTGKLFLHHKEGHRVPVSVTTAPILDDAGVVIGGLETFHDATTEMSALSQVDDLKALSLLCTTTGVGNRRYAEQMLESKFAEMKRNRTDLGVVFMDIDHFKSINDQYGHRVGDVILKMVARTLANAMRSNDFLARWGGEEFIAILPNLDRPQLALLANRLRALVEKSSATISNGTLVVTISVGAVATEPDDEIASVIQRSDALMYKSKSLGRNRVTIE
jgi:diguanylate cyclase (GGDEF)-like protein/PAS domain S-box-containing protein